MNKDAIDKIAEWNGSIVEALEHATMPFTQANNIINAVNAIDNLVKQTKKEIDEDKTALLDIIEGLMANWPSTEIIEYYTPEPKRAALLRKEALARGATVLQGRTSKPVEGTREWDAQAMQVRLVQRRESEG